MTGPFAEEEDAGFSAGQKAVGESGGGWSHSQAVLVSELARTSQAGRGERLGPRPLAAICSFTHRLGLPLLVRQQNSCH